VDDVWDGRPAEPISAVLPHDITFAGESAADKRRVLAGKLKRDGRNAAVISAPDSLCWLLNVRGADVPRTPFARGYAVLHDDARVDLFIDRRKLPPQTMAHLGNEVKRYLNSPNCFAALALNHKDPCFGQRSLREEEKKEELTCCLC
jgi:Xaa-Pro aminopeptidase